MYTPKHFGGRGHSFAFNWKPSLFKMASRSLALGAHLTKCTYSIPLNTSEELLKFFKDCYPTLDIEVAKVEGHEEKRVIVCCALYSHNGSAGLLNQLEWCFIKKATSRLKL